MHISSIIDGKKNIYIYILIKKLKLCEEKMGRFDINGEIIQTENIDNHISYIFANVGGTIVSIVVDNKIVFNMAKQLGGQKTVAEFEDFQKEKGASARQKSRLGGRRDAVVGYTMMSTFIPKAITNTNPYLKNKKISISIQ
jgi:hypothetical protein